MTETVRLGHIAGVRVGLHWSVLGIVVLLTAGLAGALLPEQFPGYSLVVYVIAALVATVLFVASLLAHEVGHAVVALRNQIPVEGITLWLLGGMANLKGEIRSPRVDFRVAAVGPAISFLLGLGFGMLAWALATAGSTGIVTGIVAYLAGINILLAAFNLIPAAPLDGGRILRAILWAWRGDQMSAQIWSARAGRGFGFALIILGAINLFTGYIGGLWWILIGLFVVTMAGAEEQQARTGSMLSGVRVGDVMTSNPDTADGQATVADFLRDVALVRRHTAFPLVGPEGRVDGLITLNRIRGVAPDDRAHKRVAEVACPAAEIPFTRLDELLTDLLPRLGGCADGRALVLDADDRLAGIVSPSDVNRALTLHQLGATEQDGADLNYTAR